ncbi:hypothetical protein D3C81_1680020 [compost metagenome]
MFKQFLAKVLNWSGYSALVKAEDAIENASILIDFSFEDTSVVLTRKDGTEVAKFDTGDYERNCILAEELCQKMGEPYAWVL